MMNIDIRMKNMQDWYSKLSVQYNIIKFTKNRECAFIVPQWASEELQKRTIRMMKIHSTQHFVYLMQTLNVFERQTPYNFYVSLAEFNNGIPNQDLTNNMKNRDNKQFYADMPSNIKQYDFVVEVDAHKHENMAYAEETVNIIILILDAFKVKYEIRFSGRGFHIYIPLDLSVFVIDTDAHDNIFAHFNKLRKQLHDLYSFMVDLDYVFTPVSVLKIPFTIANYEDVQYVCMPLSIDEFRNFDLSKYELTNMLKSFNAKYIPQDINLLENSKNFIRFSEYISVEVGKHDR